MTASYLHRQDKCQRITPPPAAQCGYSHMGLYFASTKERKYTWPGRRPGSISHSECGVWSTITGGKKGRCSCSLMLQHSHYFFIPPYHGQILEIGFGQRQQWFALSSELFVAILQVITYEKFTKFSRQQASLTQSISSVQLDCLSSKLNFPTFGYMWNETDRCMCGLP